ncbi:MAG: restriction endonuclease subunit S [Candidatus Brocadiaceae bacterium]|nr:restriction endonuclease subunit S [Candidatus Brocadiaceae bacterium]
MIDKSKLPPSWEVVKLGDVCEIFQGYGFPIIMQRKSKGKFPFYKVGDISRNVLSGNQYLEYCENYIDDEELQKLKAKPYPKKTIVFAKIGEALKLNRRALTKYPCIVDNNAVGLKAVEIICSDLFLFFFLKLIKLEKYSRATTVPSVRKSEIKAIEIPLPPLPEQHRIVAKIEELFSELDKGIESLKTARQQLKIYRQAVLKWAFEGKLTHENVKDGELPEGWKWVKLGEVCEDIEIVKRKEKNGETEFLYLDIGGIDNLTNKIVNHKQYKWKEAPSRAQQIIFKDDVLFSTVRTYLKNIAIVEKNIYNGAIASSGFTVIRGNKEITNPKFLFYLSLSHLFLQPLNELQTGSSYPAVRDKDVFSQSIPLPSLLEQHQIVQEIETRLSVCDKLEETITTALQKSEALRQSILKKAFEGRLVEQNPNDEPASKLLERIRAEKAAEQRHIYRKRNKPTTNKAPEERNVNE